jgi:hypothetical protein
VLILFLHHLTTGVIDLSVGKKLPALALIQEASMKVLSDQLAVSMGYSPDKRKRRREHRNAAKELMASGTLLNPRTSRNTILGSVAWWHLQQARYL